MSNITCGPVASGQCCWAEPAAAAFHGGVEHTHFAEGDVVLAAAFYEVGKGGGSVDNRGRFFPLARYLMDDGIDVVSLGDTGGSGKAGVFCGQVEVLVAVSGLEFFPQVCPHFVCGGFL